jgi:hypothetical protein
VYLAMFHGVWRSWGCGCLWLLRADGQHEAA